MKTVRVELFLTREKAEEILRFARYKKLCGDLNPDVDPADWLLVEFVREFVEQEAQEGKPGEGEKG